jgi:hypothetical protein
MPALRLVLALTMITVAIEPSAPALAERERCMTVCKTSTGGCEETECEPARCERSCRQKVADCIDAECAGLAGRERMRCRKVCREKHGCAGPRIGTLAYVLTECEVDAQGNLLGAQELRIRRGNCEDVTVVRLELDVAVKEPPFAGCRFYGQWRVGGAVVSVAPFHRVSVTPDGSGVLFDVSNGDVRLVSVPDEIEGMWLVRADGTGLRRLHEPIRVSQFKVLPEYPYAQVAPDTIRFSPDGRRIVFTDLDDQDVEQIFTTRIANGRTRTQLTSLPRATASKPWAPATGWASFIDDETIGFVTHADYPPGANPEGGRRQFTVGVRGKKGPLDVTADSDRGSSLGKPGFTIVGGGSLYQLEVASAPANSGPTSGRTVEEIAFLTEADSLQLTNFGRADTAGAVLDMHGKRAFFSASANPNKSTCRTCDNPSENCQIFSIGNRGQGLRQLTHFRHTDQSTMGCIPLPVEEGPLTEIHDGCFVFVNGEYAIGGAVVFETSCDPFCSRIHGERPCNLGGNIFAMRPDGSGMRQLTHARTVTRLPEGGIHVELPGPWAYGGR